MLNQITIGEMSRSFRSTRQIGALKLALERLSAEVTTGRTTDTANEVKGDFLPLASIERSIKSLEWYQNSLAKTQVFVATAQRSLDTIQTYALRSGTNLISLSGNAQITVLGALTNDTRQVFASVLSALNIQIGERTVFAGVDTNSPAVTDIETIMAELVTATATATNAQEVTDAITTWFDTPGGGFETLGYLGSTQRLQDFDLGQGQFVSFDAAADDQEVRDLLKGFAMGAILEDGTFVLANDEMRNLVRMAGEALLIGDKKFAEYRAVVGTTEAAIHKAQIRNSAEMFALEMARAKIVNVDQYAAAGLLQATQVQLEMLYSLTARMSRLNLMEFLR